jgi:cell division protein FtsZ
MTLTLTPPEQPPELKPRIIVFGIGGAGGNAVNNMIRSNLEGVECVVANTDAQALSQCLAERKVQLGLGLTQGLGAGSRPEVGRAAAEEGMEELISQIQGGHMVFVTAGMGGGTGTGAAPVIAAAARELGLLTVGVVTKPFHFEGSHRMELADEGISNLEKVVDTLIVIPNQNLFKVADEKTTFTDAFQMADEVLYAGVRGVTELMISPGLINLDFADIRSIMDNGGKAMMGSGEADGESRALASAEAAIANPLLEDSTLSGASGCLINITGGPDLTLYEVDEAANRIRDEVDPSANIIFGSVLDEALEGRMRVSIFATGVDSTGVSTELPAMGTATRTPIPPPVSTPVNAPITPASDGIEDGQISILSSSIGGVETDDGEDSLSFEDPGETTASSLGDSLGVGTADPVRISPASSRLPEAAEPVGDVTAAPIEQSKEAVAEPEADVPVVADVADVPDEPDMADAPEPGRTAFVLDDTGPASEFPEIENPEIENPETAASDFSPTAESRAVAGEDLPGWPEAETGQPDMFTGNRESAAGFGQDPVKAATDIPDASVSSNRSLRQALLAEDSEPSVIEDDTPAFLKNVGTDTGPKDGGESGHKRSFLSRLVKRSSNDDKAATLPANDETAEATPHFADSQVPAAKAAPIADPIVEQTRESSIEPGSRETRVLAPERSLDTDATVVLDSNHRVSSPPAEQAVTSPPPRPSPAASTPADVPLDFAPSRPAEPVAAASPPLQAEEPAAQVSAAGGASAPTDDELLEIPAFLRRQSN